MPFEKTEDYIRARQTDPDQYTKLRTIDFSREDGVKAVVGKTSTKAPMEVQSVLFDRNKWTESEAKDWLEAHEQFHASDSWLIALIGVGVIVFLFFDKIRKAVRKIL